VARARGLLTVAYGYSLALSLPAGIEIRRWKAWHLRAVNDTRMAELEVMLRDGAIEKWQLSALHLCRFLLLFSGFFCFSQGSFVFLSGRASGLM